MRPYISHVHLHQGHLQPPYEHISQQKWHPLTGTHIHFLAGSPVKYSSGCKCFCHKSYMLFTTTKCSHFIPLVASKWIFPDHKLTSHRPCLLQDWPSVDRTFKHTHTIVRMVNPWPPSHLNYRGEYRAVMQTPVTEKPSRTPELYLNTNDKNKQCSIHTKYLSYWFIVVIDIVVTRKKGILIFFFCDGSHPIVFSWMSKDLKTNQYTFIGVTNKLEI